MGKAYREYAKMDGIKTTSDEMRLFCIRPGKVDKDGNPLYFTEQSHKDQCDINNIIRKYDKTGVITHVSKFEGQFGDMTGLDFKDCQDKVIGAKRMFDELPSPIRKRFNNSPYDLLLFMEDPGNREEAISLGIINPDWTPETDGLGEHVPEGGNKVESAE